jgi:tetratricopeptide (TPR) repeat protein
MAAGLSRANVAAGGGRAVVPTLPESQFDAALKTVDSAAETTEEKAEMLMEIAMGMQVRPKTPDQLQRAIDLYRRALDLAEDKLLRARITARLGTALQALPAGGTAALKQARDAHEAALPILREHGSAAEVAEAEINLGLVVQSLAGTGAARLQDAIQSYHRALRTFTCDTHPHEYAILHNNLAIAYLSLPMADERAKMREALAVQSFEEVLRVVTLVDHPSEYAMIQNNLGNALQYASSGHPLDNNLRALAAYAEALKVRNERDTPLEYASTIANKANVLRNLPEDPDRPGLGREASLTAARELYQEARRIMLCFDQAESAGMIDDALAGIAEELALLPRLGDNVRPGLEHK